MSNAIPNVVADDDLRKFVIAVCDRCGTKATVEMHYSERSGFEYHRTGWISPGDAGSLTYCPKCAITTFGCVDDKI
jgi:hypothetical protein